MAGPALRVVVIMAGGGGARLWPVSTPTRPKQLLRLSQRPPHTMLAAAIERARRLTSLEWVFVVTNIALAPAVAAAVPELLPENILSEPRQRSTAPCVALALVHVRQRLRDRGVSPKDIERVTVAVLPADHHIAEPEGFIRLLAAGCDHAEQHNAIVTLGVEPRGPSTGYGYLERGPEPVAKHGSVVVYSALRFVEKPDAVRAQVFFETGRFLWNAGIFLMPLGRISREFQRHAPGLSAALAPVAAALARGVDPWPATVAAYEHLKAEPVDTAVMEKQRDLCVIPMAGAWTDLGSWAAIHEALPHDGNDNVIVTPPAATTHLINTRDSLVWSDDLEVAVVGMTGVAVIVSGGRVLVCPLDQAEEVRRLGERGRR